MPVGPRIGLAAAILAAALAFATVPARAGTSCAEEVVAAWTKGALGSTFPVRCYQQALASLPADVATYSTAPDDIRRAMLVALGNERTEASDADDAPWLLVAAGCLLALAAALLGPRAIRLAVRGASAHRSRERFH